MYISRRIGASSLQDGKCSLRERVRILRDTADNKMEGFSLQFNLSLKKSYHLFEQAEH